MPGLLFQPYDCPETDRNKECRMEVLQAGSNKVFAAKPQPRGFCCIPMGTYGARR